jgi:tRNA G10  N-methylase Trm11
LSRYNEGLKEHHNKRRQETLVKLQTALDTIESLEGEKAVITAHKILQYTDLSRLTLYKEHVLKIWNPQLWEERYIKKSKIEKKLEVKYSNEVNDLMKQIEDLNKQLVKAQKMNEKLKSDFEKEKKRREVKEIELEESIFKHKRLLAECQRLQTLIEARS